MVVPWANLWLRERVLHGDETSINIFVAVKASEGVGQPKNWQLKT